MPSRRAPRLVVICQSRGGRTERFVEALYEGATDRDIAADIEVTTLQALDGGPEDILTADAVVLATPEHFGYMSGAMKHFLESIYHPCLELTIGKPWALLVSAGTDGTGTVSSVERIVTGLGWKKVHPPLVLVAHNDDWTRPTAATSPDLEACKDLGRYLAAGLDAGLW